MHRCTTKSLSRPLKKPGCDGDDDGDCLDNALEDELAREFAPYYFYDEEESCAGAPYIPVKLRGPLGGPLNRDEQEEVREYRRTHYSREDFVQVRPRGTPGRWQPDDDRIKALAITYFFLHPHDCQQPPLDPIVDLFKDSGHQGDSERVVFTLKSRDLRDWTLVYSEYYHHKSPKHNFSGEYLSRVAREIDNQNPYPVVAADEDGHGSWPGKNADSDHCAGAEDKFYHDCFRGDTIKSAFNNRYYEWTGNNIRNIGEPGHWRSTAVTVDGEHAYSTFDVGHGSNREYWSKRNDVFRKFCGWECPPNRRQVDGDCGDKVHGDPECTAPLSDKVDHTPFTGPPDPTCESGIRAGRACCAASCGTCGGTGCGQREGGADACCVGRINSGNRSCAEFPPPCRLP